MPRSSFVRLLGSFLGAAALLCAPAPRAHAQGVHPDVGLTQPFPGNANGLSVLAEATVPVVGVFAPPAADDSAAAYNVRAAESVREWEYLLLGFGIRYRILEDSSLTAATLAPLRLVVLPASEVLSNNHRQAVRQYLDRGGSVIASGAIGVRMDARGTSGDDAFMRDVFGLRLAGVLPDTINGVDLTLNGGHAMVAGLPDGFRFNVGRAPGLTPAIPLRNEPLGTTSRYSGDLLPEDPTLLAYGTFGRGHFAWLGFTGRDVSMDDDSRQVYQAFLVNAMAYLTRTPAVSVAPWPNGAASAFAIAVLPEIGHQPYEFLTAMDVLLEALEAGGARATFFLTTDESVFYPQMVARMKDDGEVAISADTDDLLAGQPAVVQEDRFRHAIATFRQQTGASPSGIYPPGGLRDTETLKTAHASGLSYIVETGSTLRVPSFVAWDRELDYRDSLTLGVDSGPSMLRFSLTELTNPTYWNRAATPNAMVVRMASALKGDFDRVHNGGGLFLYPLYPGIQALTQRRADVVEVLARHARSRGSWMATLAEIDAWWRLRSGLTVRMESPARGDDLAVMVENAGSETVRGVALELVLHERASSVVSVEGARWEADTGDGVVQVVLDSVPPGTTTIRVRLAPRAIGLSATR
jgi:peptidoglycan/xylan/chitin deacetylase (PgdA/CDA1 family)